MGKLDNLIYSLGAFGVCFGGLWQISIILYGDVPDYVKQAAVLFLGGVVIMYYYDNVKGKKSDS
jgi:hypothetical protein